MSRHLDPHGVIADDPDDLELGGLAFSKTHFKSGDLPRGGTIIGVSYDDPDDDRTVRSVFTLEQFPGYVDVFEIDRADIDMDNMPERYFYACNAIAAADVIHRWLNGPRKPRNQQVFLLWQRREMDLRELATRGSDHAQQWLPLANARAERFAEAQRAAS